MPTRRPAADHLVRTSQLGPEDALHVRHPLNPRSDLFMTRLGDRTGLSHLGISLARLPPGRESFTLHAHSVQEEWIFVLSGSGHVRIEDETLPIGAGDFLGFPAGGAAHLICNTSDADLVYLQGGDRREGDRGRFPELGLVGWAHDDGHMALVEASKVSLRPFSDWIARDPDED